MSASGQSRALRIRIVSPAPPSSSTGNGVTARRWARHLRDLGHRVAIEQGWSGGRADVLLALHAAKSAASVERFAADRPGAPIVVALTGTDVYGGTELSPASLRSVALADRTVVLQPLALERLPVEARARCVVIHQSAVAPPGEARPSTRTFDAAVLAHLRAVKDPLLAATAARLLPASSKVRIVHAGGALDAEAGAAAAAEAVANARYRWLGDRPRWQALRLLARSRLLVLTSVSEGGANVVSEALACGVPVLSTAIPGSVGILGPDYPGYFPVGDAPALAGLLGRAEVDPSFLAELTGRVRALAHLVDPGRERECWAVLLRSL